MGDDSNKKKNSDTQGAPNNAAADAAPAKPESGQASPVSPQATMTPPGPAADTSTSSIPVTGRSTVIKHVEQNPAEVQFAKMNQDMSSMKPEFSSSAPAASSAPVQATQNNPTAHVAAEAVAQEVTASTQENTEEAAEPQGPVRSSIIAEGTEITGEVKFGSDAEVYGTLNAKVVSEDDILTNTGTITGDVVAKNLDMLNAVIKGDVATYGDLRLSDSSVLTGDVAAMRMDLRGQLVGNSAVRREMNVHSTAKLAGDIEAGSLAVGHGAKVRGFVNVGYEEE